MLVQQGRRGQRVPAQDGLEMARRLVQGDESRCPADPAGAGSSRSSLQHARRGIRRNHPRSLEGTGGEGEARIFDQECPDLQFQGVQAGQVAGQRRQDRRGLSARKCVLHRHRSRVPRSALRVQGRNEIVEREAGAGRCGRRRSASGAGERHDSALRFPSARAQVYSQLLLWLRDAQGRAVAQHEDGGHCDVYGVEFDPGSA